ncbi:MAG: S8 family peptidase [bacterium]|nr:MAG: S8 family peptidase [bacterium]
MIRIRRISTICAFVILVSALSFTGASAQDSIAVDAWTPVGFQPADYSILPTNYPIVRITLPDTFTLPTVDSVYVILDDWDPATPPMMDITYLFADLLTNRIDTAQVSMTIGNNMIQVLIPSQWGLMVQSATMLNYIDPSEPIVPHVSDTVTAPDGVTFIKDQLFIQYVDGVTDLEISNFQSLQRLTPIGLLRETNGVVVHIENPQNDSLMAWYLADTLSDPVVNYVVLNSMIDKKVVALETYNSAAFRGSYNAGSAGFGEGDLAWAWQNHFMETYASHRLIEVATQGLTDPGTPRLAIIDDGLVQPGLAGNPNPTTTTDLNSARFLRSTGAVGGTLVLPGVLRQVDISALDPNSGSDVIDGIGPGARSGNVGPIHGLVVTQCAASDGSTTLQSIGKDVNIRYFQEGDRFNDDGDGATDEDPWGDENNDLYPGRFGVDDDADGLTDYDDLHVRIAARTRLEDDDDEDRRIDEDPVDGADNDGDGRTDEDPPGDDNGDGWPGGRGVDDDGDGTTDYNDIDYLIVYALLRYMNDDDEDALIDEDPVGAIISTAHLAAAITACANEADIDVINLSKGSAGRNRTEAQNIARRTAVMGAIQGSLIRATNRGKIIVVSAGNESIDVELSTPACLAPQNTRDLAAGEVDADNDGFPDPAEDTNGNGDLDIMPDLLMAVSATDIINDNFKGTDPGNNISDISGWETFCDFSNRGDRISVSAAGGQSRWYYDTRGVAAHAGRGTAGNAPVGNEFIVAGTSFSAPTVAGLAAEMIYFDQVLRNANAGLTGNALLTRRLQIVEMIEATADDLGTSNIGNGTNTESPNDEAGNGLDEAFGHGRINAWKAMLAVANDGISKQPGRTSAAFPSLSILPDADTEWYGFEIITSVKGATVWIDGIKQTDAGATIPNTPDATAYKGVIQDRVVYRGIDINSDGNPDEDPTSGIVPIGNDGGEYYATFSIERGDIAGKTLSLRRPGETEDDPPFYNLRLELDKMREGKVPGVIFDDFVFEITPTDFGDAQDVAKRYPTILSSDGAHSLNSNLEWFGRAGSAAFTVNDLSVSPEPNAFEEEYPDATIDPDGTMNLGRKRTEYDLDRFDHGVRFYPLQYKPGSNGIVEFVVCVADMASGRYVDDPDKSLYVNAWIDWNTNRVWEEGAALKEHIINGLRIDPSNNFAFTEPPGIDVTLLGTGANWAKYKVEFPVGDINLQKIFARFRLDYGENAGQNDPSHAGEPSFQSDPKLDLVKGPSRFGEIEDYLIGSDFGDAPDPFMGAGKYPTKKENQGARHLHIYWERLGAWWPGLLRPPQAITGKATREIDAIDLDTDEDIHPNLNPEDTDEGDYAIHPPTFTFRPGVPHPYKITVTSSISSRGFDNSGSAGVMTLGDDCELVAIGAPAKPTPGMSQGRGRYSAGNAQKRLYLHGWADWDGDGEFETAEGEKFLHAPVDPETFGPDGKYTLGEWFEDTNHNGVWDNGENYDDIAGIDAKAFDCEITMPDSVFFPDFYIRFRLDYGEDGTTVDLADAHIAEVGRTLNEEKGGALYGEVEDHRVFLGWHWGHNCPWEGLPFLSYPGLYYPPFTPPYGTIWIDAPWWWWSCEWPPEAWPCWFGIALPQEFLDNGINVEGVYFKEYGPEGGGTLQATLSYDSYVTNDLRTNHDMGDGTVWFGYSIDGYVLPDSIMWVYYELSYDDQGDTQLEGAMHFMAGDSAFGWSSDRYEDVTASIALAVTLASFTANGLDGQAIVEWTTASEIGTAGFNIHRSTDEDGEYERINKEPIPAEGNELEGASYSYTDRAVTNGVTYYYRLEDIDLNGRSTFHGPVTATTASAEDGDEPKIPDAFNLAQNIPNPFNAITEIKYGLPVDCDVTLTIFNVAGQRIRMLVNEHQAAGYKTARWDGKNDEGLGVSSGIYFYRLDAGSFVEVKKMVLLR